MLDVTIKANIESDLGFAYIKICGDDYLFRFDGGEYGLMPAFRKKEKIEYTQYLIDLDDLEENDPCSFFSLANYQRYIGIFSRKNEFYFVFGDVIYIVKVLSHFNIWSKSPVLMKEDIRQDSDFKYLGILKCMK